MRLIFKFLSIFYLLTTDLFATADFKNSWIRYPFNTQEYTYTVSDKKLTGTEYTWNDPLILVFGTYDKLHGLYPEYEKILEHYGRNSAYNFLSNYYPQDIVIDDLSYKSVEHFYQAIKFDIGSVAYQEVVNAATADEARAIAHQHSAEAHLGGDEEMVSRMKLGLWAKFVNDDCSPTELGELLMDTKNYLLIEGNCRPNNRSDKRWGAEFDFSHLPSSLTLTGRNFLGELLMELRSFLFIINQNNRR